MPSLYAKYMKEREEKETYELAEGFAVYSIVDKECYIETIYVMPDFRKLGIAAKMADHITEIAKEKGCTYLAGTVDPRTNGATESIKALLAYGFVLREISVNEEIILTKNL